MPSYMCASATVKLSVADLEASTTQAPIGYACKELAEHLQVIQDEIQRGEAESPLAEVPIYTDEEHPSHLRFLGPHHDMPFLLVQAGKGLFTPGEISRAKSKLAGISTPELASTASTFPNPANTTAKLPTVDSVKDVLPKWFLNSAKLMDQSWDESNPQSSLTDSEKNTLLPRGYKKGENKTTKKTPASFSIDVSSAPQTQNQSLAHQPSLHPGQRKIHRHNQRPLALSLAVTLSKQSFLCQPLPRSTKPTALDVKIELYFNGELCGSAYVPNRIKSDPKASELTQRFGGRRIERLLERPWIITPPGKNNDGTQQDNKRDNEDHGSAQQHWNAISELLKVEAEKGGRDKWGELGVLGTYLESLAKFPMPAEVEKLQRAGRPRFGIIDVIITTGKGKKNEPELGYIAVPANMRILQPVRETYGKPKSSGLATTSSNTPQIAPKPVRRVKTYADAEIVASGFQSKLAPRVASASAASVIGNPSTLNRPVKDTVATAGVFQAPKPLATALAAVHERRMLAPLRKLLPKPIEGLAWPLTSANNGVTVRQETPEHATVSGAIDYHALPPAPEKAEQARSSTTRNMPVSPLMELPNPKRRKIGDPTTPTSAGRISDTPGFFTSPYLTPYKGRIRGSQGYFIKRPKWKIGDPGLPPHLGRPRNIPLKRFKGTEEAAAEERRREERERAKSKPQFLISPAENQPKKPTLAEEIAAIERAAATPGPPTVLGSCTPNLGPRRGSRTLTSQALQYTSPLFKRKFASQAPQYGNALSKPRKMVILRLSPIKLAFVRDRPRTPVPSDNFLLLPESPLTPLDMTPAKPGLSENIFTPINKRKRLDAFENTPSTLATHSEVDDKGSVFGTPSYKAKWRARAQQTPSETTQDSATVKCFAKRHPKVGTAPVTWMPNAVNEGCAIGFAPMGVVRQVRSERSGWFQESSVLLGVRFLVGG